MDVSVLETGLCTDVSVNQFAMHGATYQCADHVNAHGAKIDIGDVILWAHCCPHYWTQRPSSPYCGSGPVCDHYLKWCIIGWVVNLCIGDSNDKYWVHVLATPKSVHPYPTSFSIWILAMARMYDTSLTCNTTMFDVIMIEEFQGARGVVSSVQGVCAGSG